MRVISPPEAVHALDLDALRVPEITFWTVWDGETLAGCGALKEIEADHGEIKSMHTAAAYRGRGVAATLLKHVVETARTRGYNHLSLETGSTHHFTAAQTLYSRNGFTECGPFGSYQLDPHSLFMTRSLAG